MSGRLAGFLIFAVLAGCAGPSERSFAVGFAPFSADLDPSARATVQAAASYAATRAWMPLSIDGFHARPDPTEPDTIQQERVQVVTSALVNAGVERWRIEVLGTGIVYPQGIAMPRIPVRTVVIKVGL